MMRASIPSVDAISLGEFPSLPRVSDQGERFSDLPKTTRWKTRQAEKLDRMGPGLAGGLVGLLAGPLAVAVFAFVLRRMGLQELRGLLALGQLLERKAALGLHPLAHVAVLASLAGATFGAVYALMTRHLRRYAPLLVWSLLAFPVFVTAMLAFVIPVVAPRALAAMPFVPLLVAAEAFALAVSLQLPLRKRELPAYLDPTLRDS
jgi:hypothetical protein